MLSKIIWCHLWNSVKSVLTSRGMGLVILSICKVYFHFLYQSVTFQLQIFLYFLFFSSFSSSHVAFSIFLFLPPSHSSSMSGHYYYYYCFPLLGTEPRASCLIQCARWVLEHWDILAAPLYIYFETESQEFS